MFAVAKALFAAVVLGGSSVLAADVPVFSANDDYDEVNLNIRLLAAHTNTTTTVPRATISGEPNFINHNHTIFTLIFVLHWCEAPI